MPIREVPDGTVTVGGVGLQNNPKKPSEFIKIGENTVRLGFHENLWIYSYGSIRKRDEETVYSRGVLTKIFGL